ncbi:MAG: rhomboid family intramembrane serine protease [Pseudanabaenaceae cyanobacterium bins.39]|nr:rhomboid family intramembrane serine protease [Pseudanabaenaceae cyanobacterium bins.39]
MKQKLQSIGAELKTQIKVLLSITAIFWIVFLVNDLFFRHSLIEFGIRPRNFTGLRGILFAPFLHGGFYHIVSNTFSFLTFGWLVMLYGMGDFYFVSVISAITAGLGTWVVGSPGSVHIGASGVIFGYFGFLLFRGYFERSFVAIAMSVMIAASYGGLIFGVLPTRAYISWEGHLFGLLGGILAAKILANRKNST